MAGAGSRFDGDTIVLGAHLGGRDLCVREQDEDAMAEGARTEDGFGNTLLDNNVRQVTHGSIFTSYNIA